LEQLYESNNHELYIRAVDSVGTVVFWFANGHQIFFLKHFVTIYNHDRGR
jgi:hypothetical protein